MKQTLKRLNNTLQNEQRTNEEIRKETRCFSELNENGSGLPELQYTPTVLLRGKYIAMSS